MKTSPAKPLSVINRVSSLILAFVFLYGGIPKLFDISSFAKIIEAYGILPDILVYLTALILPIIEVITGIGLLFEKRLSYVSSAALLLLFIAILTYGIFMGLDIDCGCFSVGDPEHAAFSGLRTALIRDIFFLVPLLFLFWYQIKFRKNVTQEIRK